jgi:glucose/mannose-6-phosphate isomerase
MLNKTDKSNFRQVILDFPNQFLKALDFAKDKKVNGKFDKILVCGLGGSAMPGDLLNAYLKSKRIILPVEICREYTLPLSTNKNTLVFASSYSGNTEETLSCFDEAIKRGLRVVGFARGGSKLDKKCKDNNVPFVEYPNDGPDFQPRCALGYSFASMMKVLGNCGVMSDPEDEIKELVKFLNPEELEKEGKKIAKELKNLIPIIYSSEKYKEAVARICKIKINENSKTQSFYNAFPELNHNEMIGFTRLIGNYHVIIFKVLEDHERILKRFDITAKILKEKGIKVTIIEMKGKNDLEKIFSSLLLFDWVSYYLAIEAGQDPAPVKMVEDLKKRMRE